MGVRFIRKSRIARGKGDEARAFAADISAHWLDTYGVALTWGFEIGGDTGTMYWFADHDSLASLEATMQQSMGNEETNKLLNDAVDLFSTPPQDKIIYTM